MRPASISLCLSVRLIPLSLVAELLAVLAWDLVPISRGSSDSAPGLVFRWPAPPPPRPTSRPLLSH